MYLEILVITLIIITIILIVSAVYNYYLDSKENIKDNNKILLELEQVKQKNLQLESDIKSIST